eukprot:scaffold235483_cov16-Tisochrysis_lutea.AAC.1
MEWDDPEVGRRVAYAFLRRKGCRKGTNSWSHAQIGSLFQALTVGILLKGLEEMNVGCCVHDCSGGVCRHAKVRSVWRQRSS